MRLARLTVVLALAVPGLAHAIDRSSPFSPGHRTLGRATLLVVGGKFAEAEPILRSALAIDPQLVEGHYNLGVVERHLGRPQQAIEEYRLAGAGYASKDEPNRAKCLYGIALAAEDTGDPQLATNAWREYLAFDQRFGGNGPVIEIARTHLAAEERALADLGRTRPPGTQKAAR